MTRRELLTALGFATGAAVVVGGCVVPSPGATPPAPPPGVPEPGRFPDGVASGDPRPGASTIWTRVLPGSEAGPVPLLWSVSEDEAGSSIVAGGLVLAEVGRGWAVTVPVTDLPADRWLHYRFETTGPDAEVSRTGRLRTAPAATSSPDRLRFAFGSCQQITDTWFVSHRSLCEEPNLDFFMHLGDYVYVSDTGTQTVDDYRDVYRRWRREPLLRDLHAHLPVVAMWDDGEFYNGVDASGSPSRLAAAKQAWFENFPQVDPGDQRLYRSLQWGDLADVPVIDVRSYRDPAIDDSTHLGMNSIDDPARSTLGSTQLAWLKEQLGGSSARWRMIGNPYNINPWRLVNLEFLRFFRPDLPQNPGIYAPNEAWDDYMAERRDLLQFLQDHDVQDTLFCSGHTHVHLTTELKPDVDLPGSPVVAYDVCTGSLTTDPDPRTYLGDLPRDAAEEVLRVAERWVLTQNAPLLRYINLVDQGYTVVDATPDEILVTTRLIDTYDPQAEAYDAARYRILPGARRLEELPCERPRGSSN